MTWGRVLLLTAVLICLFASTAGWADATPVNSQVAAALALPDGAEVVLDGVYVSSVSDGYAAVTDIWAHSPGLLVSTDAALQPMWMVRIEGVMSTQDSHRLILASRVQLYVISCSGSPAPPLPADLLASQIGVSLVDVPAAPPQSAGRFAIPMVEEMTTEDIFDRTIGSAKKVGGQLTLAGKVVTAVFHDTTGAVSCFYIQEPDTNSVRGVFGIKVVPDYSVPLEPGNIVSIDGSVVAKDLAATPPIAECYFKAKTIKCTGNTSLPKPLGLNQRTAAMGVDGLGIIGSRVRVWGNVSATSGSTCWIDDGSLLASTVGSTQRTGIRVIYDSGTPSAQETAFTGVLGAEMDEAGNAVPVVRVPAAVVYPSASQAICVDGINGSDARTAPGWANAVKTVQRGIALASAASQNKEVWVRAGTYRENIILADGVALFGGFVGTEDSRNERDWATHKSILDGTIDSTTRGTVISVVDCTDPATRIDGFTIQNGHATHIDMAGSDWYPVCGGGIYCHGSAPTIAHNVFLGNVASSELYSTYGGAVYCGSSTPIIWSNEFGAADAANEAFYGAALAVTESDSRAMVLGNTLHYGPATSLSALYVLASPATVAGNLISGHTMGVFFEPSSILYSDSIVIQANTIRDNSDNGICCVAGSPTICDNIVANNGCCGIYCDSQVPNHHLTISHNTITGNRAGGIRFYAYLPDPSPDISYNTIADISNNIITANLTINAADSGCGAGIFCSYGQPHTTGNTISDNYAAVEGGGIMLNRCGLGTVIAANKITGNYSANHGGGIAMHTSGSVLTPVTIVNNLFVRNHTDGDLSGTLGGGAIHAKESSPTIVNNTFVENWVGTAQVWEDVSSTNLTAYGGAIHVRDNYSSPATILNNIFYDNRAYRGQSLACSENGVASITYCDTDPSNSQDQAWCYYRKLDPVYPNTAIAVDPLTLWYENPSFSPGHYWLGEGSLLRTTYHGATSPPAPNADIDNHPRPGSLGLDIGAYQNDGRQ